MSNTLAHRLRGLAHPRPRRSALWACVYCGAFVGTESGGDGPDAAGTAE